MNGSMILFILGYVLRIEGLLMLPAFLVGIIYGEPEKWAYLAVAHCAYCWAHGLSGNGPKTPCFILRKVVLQRPSVGS